ncbi:hypothetical protein [Actinosynnema sp. NPDC020468]|uniref:hypothetical protein n=1 Tax=Actinosynnema sp. NPDC020468 TaxID=3154488 RepID=UPI0033FF9B0B
MPRRYLIPVAVAAVLVTGFATPALAGDREWRADLAVTSDDVGVVASGSAITLAAGAPTAASARTAERTGFLQLAPHTLPSAANAVTAALDADVPAGTSVDVDVRGALGGDRWTEWVPAGSPLPSPATVVQVRVALTGLAARPAVRGLTLEASTVDGVTALAAGRSYRVYATREGLVGGTTANGHVIASRDHFVALPSRRGLSAKGTGTYSVQVCAGSRCEWAPVWDVGPWNTKDDYWNPAATRESWKDLPQGRPEAQAAYEDRYNGGKDQYGRVVANPAGVDLADGVFQDGLKLTTNSWVTVTYLWTGSGPAGTVRTASDPLNVRSSASSSGAQVGLAANYAQVRVECQSTGESVTGTQGTSNVWYRIAAGKYVAKAYVAGVSGAGAC